MSKSKQNRRSRKVAIKAVAILVAFMMVFYQTPISYAFQQRDHDNSAHEQLIQIDSDDATSGEDLTQTDKAPENG